MDYSIAIMGLIVGFLVGLTGVGGASLLTPILIYAGISPSIAVGTDLLYNSVTKLFGIVQHVRQKTIHFGLVRYLAYGSIPGAVVAILFLRWFSLADQNTVIKHALGIILVVVATATLIRQLIPSKRRELTVEENPLHNKRALTVAIGFVLGFVVGLTSIGSGSLFAIALIYFFRLNTTKVVGTDIAHAFLLVTVAGLLHAGLGNVDYKLALNLMIGSVPGVLIGSKLSSKVPSRPLQAIVASLILVSGFKLL